VTSSHVSRRRFLGAATALGASALLPSACGDAPAADSRDGTVAFRGDRQAGIVTPAQDRLHFASFDVTTTDRNELINLLKEWTAAAEAMTTGAAVGEFGSFDGPYLAPPDATGEAEGLGPSHLTLTFGFGKTLFIDTAGNDRFSIASRRPKALDALPHFPGDALQAERSGGDLCVQACADDPQVAVHAIRNLARIGFGRVAVRWSQLGFGRTSSTTRSQSTPRNLFGFKDGTANVKAEDGAVLDTHVWVQPMDGTTWMTGGTYLVARRINMNIETWDRTSLKEQEDVIGRDKKQGAPLSGGSEFAAPTFATVGANGEPLIAANAHVRIAHPSANGGAQMLRRGYNFTDGSNGLGRLDAGLFFIAFVRNPATQFTPVQNNLAKNDSLMEYIQHTGSALFAVPPGVVGPNDYVGASLFA
jgi:deferrochelatase/peroxidase EfeB